METLPTETKDLLKELNKLFPDTMVLDDINDFDRIKLAGKVELIRYLNQLMGLVDNLKDK